MEAKKKEEETDTSKKMKGKETDTSKKMKGKGTDTSKKTKGKETDTSKKRKTVSWKTDKEAEDHSRHSTRLFVPNRDYRIDEEEPETPFDSVMFISGILAILILCGLIGFDAGQKLNEIYLSRICAEEPAKFAEFRREWKGSWWEPVYYHCSHHPDAKIYQITYCNLEKGSWDVIFNDSCDCNDELPPLGSNMHRIPDPYPRELKTVVHYKCSDDYDSPSFAEFECSANSTWVLRRQDLSLCECQRKVPPAEPDANKNREWEKTETFLGTIVTYHCTNDSFSAIESFVVCQKNLEFTTVSVQECVCADKLPSNIPEEYAYEFSDLELRLTEEKIVHCLKYNKKSGTRMTIQCLTTGVWEISVTSHCEFAYLLKTEPANFETAAKLCFDHGGDMAVFKTKEDHFRAVQSALGSSYKCSFIYLGLEEDLSTRFLSTSGSYDSGKNMSSNIRKWNANHLKCLIIELFTDENGSKQYKITNTDCYEKHCFLCYEITAEHGKFLRKYGIPSTFYEASTFCGETDGILYPIDKLSLFNVTQELGVSDLCNHQYLIGARNIERRFKYINSEEYMNYSYFSIGQPSNFKDHCIGISEQGNFQFIDIHCESVNCYFCSLPGMPEMDAEREASHLCQLGWRQLGYSCFRVEAVDYDSNEAQTFCAQYNASLASILTHEEKNFIHDLITVAYSLLDTRPWHFGLRKVFRNKTFVYSWRNRHEFYNIMEDKTDPATAAHQMDGTVYCGMLYVYPEMVWKTDACFKKGGAVCRRDFVCQNPPEALPGQRRIWDEKTNIGAIVRYTCSLGPTATIAREMICSPEKVWEEKKLEGRTINEDPCKVKYLAVMAKGTFEQGKETCDLMNGSFATADNLDEFIGILANIRSLGSLGKNCQGYYLGVQEVQEKQFISGNFYANLDSEMWHPKNPGDARKKCVVITLKDFFKFESSYCTLHQCYICQERTGNIYKLYADKVTYEEAHKKCFEKDQILAIVLNRMQFESLVKQITASRLIEDIKTCQRYFVDIINDHREWTDVYGKQVEFLTNPAVLHSKQTFTKNCVYLDMSDHRLHDVSCSDKRCFVCEIPDVHWVKNKVALYEAVKCPTGYQLYKSNDGKRYSCLKSNKYLSTANQSHIQCAISGGSLFTYTNDDELSLLTKEYLVPLKGCIWHTGLFYDFRMNLWFWRSGKRVTKRARRKLKLRGTAMVFNDKDELFCVSVAAKKGLDEKIVAVWDFKNNTCNMPGCSICQYIPGFLGFRDLGNATVVDSSNMHLTVFSCIEFCRYSEVAFAFIFERSCLCTNDLGGDNTLLIRTTKQVKGQYVCSIPHWCVGSPGQLCGCDTEAVVYFISTDYYIGCFTLHGLNPMGKIPNSSYTEISPFYCLHLCKARLYIYAAIIRTGCICLTVLGHYHQYSDYLCDDSPYSEYAKVYLLQGFM